MSFVDVKPDFMLESSRWPFRQSSDFKSYITAEVETGSANGSRAVSGRVKAGKRKPSVFALHTQTWSYNRPLTPPRLPLPNNQLVLRD